MPSTPRELPAWHQHLEVEGLWWSPDRPDFRLHGSLRIEDGRPRLTVVQPAAGQEFLALGSARTLHGEVPTSSGIEKVTLWGHPGTHFDRHVGHNHSRHAACAVFGAHLDSYDGTRFRWSAASYHDLGTWSRINDLIASGTAETEARQHMSADLTDVYTDMFGPGYNVCVHLEHPERIETDEDFPAGVIRNFHGEKARVVFEVEPPAPPAFHRLLLRDMQSLLTFSYLGGAPVTGQWMGEDADHLLQTVERDSFDHGQFSRRGAFQMLVRVDDSVPFGQLVEQWWRLLDEHFPAPQVLTSHLHNTRGPLEQSTGSVLAAIESLHAKIGTTQQRFEPTYLESKLREIRAMFPGEINKPFRAFLKEKFQDNRPTLETRLRELVDLVSHTRMTRAGIDPDRWVGQFKRVRNSLAHTGAHIAHRSGRSDDLELIEAESRQILAMLLLYAMRLPETSIDRASAVLGAWPHRITNSVMDEHDGEEALER
ncbi:HEPN domain-containing protein [Microbacterium saperdae]